MNINVNINKYQINLHHIYKSLQWEQHMILYYLQIIESCPSIITIIICTKYFLYYLTQNKYSFLRVLLFCIQVIQKIFCM